MNAPSTAAGQAPGPAPAAPTTPADSLAELLDAVLTRDGCVLFDFDGPLADLFAAPRWSRSGQRRTVPATRALRRVLRRHGTEPPALRDPDDPHELFRRALDELAGPASAAAGPLRDALHRCLDAHERRAARTARATPGAAGTVRLLHALGLRLAVTSNNSEAAIRTHLRRTGLLACFRERGGAAAVVVGRDGDHRRMKPEPHCLHRALDRHGAPPEVSLLIGDAATDIKAARAAGVLVCGYGTTPEKARALRAAGADAVVTHMAQLTEALTSAARRASGAPVPPAAAARAAGTAATRRGGPGAA